MGEAKRNREATRQRFLDEVEIWLRPPSEEEKQLVERLQTLPEYEIERVAPEIANYMRMKVGQCHENVAAYCKLDPKNETVPVLGWSRLGDAYVCHSVVGKAKGMFCVTPLPIHTPILDFIPDPELMAHDHPEGRYYTFRDGTSVPQVVRAAPDRIIAHQTIIKERLLSGMNPYEAVSLEYVAED